MSDEIYRQQFETLSKMVKLKELLPHLYAFKWYPWAKKFFESQNKINLLLAGNQLSKSTTQIRKCVEWATNKKLWPILWPHNPKPNQFWYLYPTKDVSSIEFEMKWQALLPQDKNHPEYGWKEEWNGSHIFAVHFKSGVSLYFKTYAQDPQHLQSGSVFAMFADEEVPDKIYDELMMRLSATDGYYHMVFTATLGQEFWREAMEEIGTDKERFKDAFKQQISMYDCLKYDDGTDSHWSPERIQKIIARCKSESEVQRRVWGRFVVEEGRKYEAFSRSHNMKEIYPIPRDWHIYTGVDIGSGGEKGHPAAICFVGVRPDFKKGVCFMGWRGDGIITTTTDILDRYRLMKGELRPVMQLYDYQSADFFTVASRQGETFLHAEKSHKIGEDILNTLFKNQMLDILDTPELQKLAAELTMVKRATAKTKAKDDLIDALRYSVTKIPWDFSGIAGAPDLGKKPEERLKNMEELRRAGMLEGEHKENWDINEELEAWQELYDN